MTARRFVVLSPHLDDAVFSLGASIAKATSRGADVVVLTVFAGDPASVRTAARWDAECGFATEGEAASARRAEDERACRIVRAQPVWLTFEEEEYRGQLDEEAVWEAIAGVVADADAVLCPGFPLGHTDHRALTRLVARRLDRAPLGLYAEQPYVTWRLIGRGRRKWALPGLTARRSLLNVARMLARTAEGRRLQQPSVLADEAGLLDRDWTWRRSTGGAGAWVAKQRAVQAYTSQLRGFGPLVGTRLALYELAWGGEGVAWPAARPPGGGADRRDCDPAPSEPSAGPPSGAGPEASPR